MRILFYFGHPSQYLFLHITLRILREKGIICELLIKSKDILESLLIENGESYTNILPEGRKSCKLGLAIGLLKRDIRLLKLVNGKHYDMFVGTDPSLAHIGFIKRIPVITVLEDDINIIPKLARITFPFSTHIVTPSSCVTGKYEYKTIHYKGYMKLSYLYPKWFSKSQPIIKTPYFIIRRSKLDAHHDNNIAGLTDQIIFSIIELLKNYGDVYISSEGDLSNSLEKYKLQINSSQMHQVLADARLLISDSQSMSMEAAMLGVPSIRYSDFAGRIGVLEELEHSYGLTYGIPANNSDILYAKIRELLSIENLEAEFSNRCERMLADKIDVTAFMVWFIENYPESARIMKENPDYQNRFK